MFENIKHDLKIRRLQAAKDEVYIAYSKEFSEAKKNGDEDGIQRAYAGQSHEVETIDDEMWFMLSQYWRNKAERLHITTAPFSQSDGTWVRGETNGLWRLSPEEVGKLRSAVRKEEKERREHWQVWATLLIGFMGTLIGLVSLLIHKGS